MSLFDLAWNRCGESLLACITIFILLTGCGFQPLHHQTTDYASEKKMGGRNPVKEMAHIAIAPITGRTGQLIQNSLKDLFHSGGATKSPMYTLVIILKEEKEGLAIQQDNRATRYNLRLIANFRLLNKQNGMELIKGQTQAIAAYNVVDSDYANLISHKDAQKRAGQSVSEGIQTRIAVYFFRKQK